MTTNIKLMVVFSKLSASFYQPIQKNLESLGMIPSVYTMLAHLNEVDKERTQKLGDVALVTSGTITHTVNKMIKSNLVEKFSDDTDKRVFWIKITNYGRQTFSEVHIEHLKFLDHLLSDFSEDEKIAFTEQMKYFGKTIAKNSQQKF